MKNKKYLLLFILGSIILRVDAAPTPVGNVASAIMGCLGQECDMDSGPVCGIDASGMPRTFENRCMADLAYCRYGTYYAVVKSGEC